MSTSDAEFYQHKAELVSALETVTRDRDETAARYAQWKESHPLSKSEIEGLEKEAAMLRAENERLEWELEKSHIADHAKP